MTSEHTPPEPGSLAQEAALLAAAVREWLGAHGGPTDAAAGGWESFFTAESAANAGEPAGAASAADDPGPAVGAFHGPPWTVPPGATLCTGCPLCRLLATVAGSRAEVMTHLLSAAASLAAAARAAWPPADGAFPGPAASPAPPRQPTQRTRPDHDRVQRIDISE